MLSRTVSCVLVLAPHIDDGEFGCGGSIARLVEEGADVHYVAFSACEQSVPDGFPEDVLIAEVEAATEILGIGPGRTRIERFEVRSFDRHRQEILDVMVSLYEELKPDLVFMPTVRDLHQDHCTVANEGLRAFKRTSILAYEMPWNNLSFQTQCFIPLEERHVQKKLEALECYSSQQSRPYISAEYQRAHLLTRGRQVETPYAECFEVVRWILRQPFGPG